MAYSRVEKYQELRDGLKEEAGINREKVTESVKVDDEDDDFLSFIKKDEKPIDLEDTLTEAKTFEQMREEGSKELEQALRSAKKGVGKENQFNTRMDILSKIREPEKATIKIDSVDEYKTDEFARGMFLNEPVEEKTETVDEKTNEDTKKKMTLMERLASISPEEDAKKAQKFLQEEKEVEREEVVEENEPDKIEDFSTPVQDFSEIEREENYREVFNEEENDDKDEVKKDSKIVKVLDIIIAILVVMLIVLFGVIVYQSFF